MVITWVYFFCIQLSEQRDASLKNRASEDEGESERDEADVLVRYITRELLGLKKEV